MLCKYRNNVMKLILHATNDKLCMDVLFRNILDIDEKEMLITLVFTCTIILKASYCSRAMRKHI